MGLSTRYRLNTGRAGGEVVDDEAILIDFHTGAYYSLPGSGAVAWELLASGASRDEVVDRMAARYDATDDVIAPAVDELISRLLGEQLIVADPDQAAPTLPELPVDGEPEPFEVPELAKYSDMEHLLLLDPVHEVGTGGWPVHEAP